jgi:predicted transcriptional regulator
MYTIGYMGRTAVITTRVDEEMLDALDKLASRSERTRAWIIAKAIERYVEEESAFQAFVQEGLDELDRGEFYTQEQMEAWFAARYPSKA